jgi:hypothetical protein
MRSSVRSRLAPPSVGPGGRTTGRGVRMGSGFAGRALARAGDWARSRELWARARGPVVSHREEGMYPIVRDRLWGPGSAYAGRGAGRMPGERPCGRLLDRGGLGYVRSKLVFLSGDGGRASGADPRDPALVDPSRVVRPENKRVPSARRGSGPGRALGGNGSSILLARVLGSGSGSSSTMRTVKCHKGIWWMPWR